MFVLNNPGFALNNFGFALDSRWITRVDYKGKV
jgi:hypothetical protein